MSLLDTASLIVTPNGYKEGKLYSVIPSDGSGDMSVTRATTATRVNSAGLVELVPYNLVQYSQEFDNASWVKVNASVTANTTTSPDGTSNADSLVENTATNLHLTYQFFTSTATTYTYSCYIKPDTRTRAYLRTDTSAGTTRTLFDLTGAGSVVTLAHTSATITLVGNGWYRCTITFTEGTGAANRLFAVEGAVGTSISYAGNGLTAFYLYGAQLVEGISARDYQKTETRLDIPRLDYSLGGCPNILLEPQRTNLLTYSEDFSNAAWEKQLGSSVTANTTTAPDGTMTADTLTIAPNQYMHQLQGLSSGTSYTISFYCKVASGTKQFNMHTYSPSGNINYSPTLTATTEWQRFEFTITANATASTSIYPVLVDSFASGSFFIWGAQMEVGSYATSYIPTTSASVTRNADVISKTGISSLIGQTEGTIFYEFSVPIVEDITRVISVSGASVSNRINISTFSGSIFVRVDVGGANQVNSSATISVTNMNKIAFRYKQNDFSLYVNGVNVITDTSGVTFPASTLDRISNLQPDGTFPFNGNIKNIALWKTALTNAELAQLTTI